MTDFKVVIPARIGSARLPGKPLLSIGELPMIVHVARQAALSGAGEVIVATDDHGIRRAVAGAGHRALITRSDHPAGSDRVAEVAASEGWPDNTIVINVQGDEPLLPPDVVRQLGRAMASDETIEVATLCQAFAENADIGDPNSVKVVRDARQDALYFSRSPIPAVRADRTRVAPVPHLRHIGVYGFRAGALRRFVAMPVGALERAEGLEQLRLLEQGVRIRVLDACREVPRGVDTAEDLERVRGIVAADSAAGP